MSPATASRSSYRSLVIEGKARTQREKIMLFMEQHQLPRNRREISIMTGYPINVVTGRVNALIEDGALIEEHFCVDPVTNRRVGYVEPPTVYKSYTVPDALLQGKLL